MKALWPQLYAHVASRNKVSDMVTLVAGQLELVLAPETGGAIARFTRSGRPLFRPVDDPRLVAQHGAVAAYPLIPFSNRVGYGSFSWQNENYQLAPNFAGEPHTIHGNGWMRSWRLDASSPREARLSLDHAPPVDPAAEWPFHYRAEQLFRLDEDGLEITLDITNQDERIMPAGIGLHPYVVRERETVLQFGANTVWLSGPDLLPERVQPLAGRWDYHAARLIAAPAIDNGYDGWDGAARITWPERGEVLTISGPTTLRHLVLYTPEGRDYFGIEPVSHMPNALNRQEFAGNGVVALAPGGHLTVTIRVAIADLR